MSASNFRQHEILRVKREIASLQDYLRALESDVIETASIDELIKQDVQHHLRVRAYNALRRAGCTTIGDAVMLVRSGKLAERSQVGTKVMGTIINALREWGIDVEDYEVVNHAN